MSSGRSKILIRSQDRNSGSSHNFDAVLPQRLLAGTYELKAAGIPVSYFNINETNNTFSLVYTKTNDSKTETVTVTVTPGLYLTASSFLTAIQSATNAALTAAGFTGTSVSYGYNAIAMKWTLTAASNDTVTFASLNNTTKFLGFTSIPSAAKVITADSPSFFFRNKYITINVNNRDQYAELKHGAPLTSFVIPIYDTSTYINYNISTSFPQRINLTEDETVLTFSLHDDTGVPLNLNGSEWWCILERI